MHYEKFADGTVKCIEDEIPFDLPDGWAWTRLGTICPYGDTIKISADDIKDDEWILDLEDIEKDTGRILYYAKKSERNSVSQKHRFMKGQLLYSKLRPYLNKVLIAPDNGYCTSEILPLAFYSEILPEYVRTYLMSDAFLAYVDLISYGVKMPRLGTDDGKRALISIPPINEQKCIARKVQDLTPVITSIGIKSDELFSIIKSIKFRILDLAIRGKLVPQDPNDEPASVLLERIRAEKEALIKAGRIKRDKKESVILRGEDNSYYDIIPYGWETTSLREITTPLSLNDGDWILSENMNIQGTVNLLQLGSIGFMEYLNKGFKHLTEDTFHELGCTEIHGGYLLINRIISDKMNCCIIPELAEKTITTVDTCWVSPCESSYVLKYIMYMLSSQLFQKAVLINASGTTRKRISKNNLIDLTIMFPPLAEQQRIVEAIETAFVQLDSISQSLS